MNYEKEFNQEQQQALENYFLERLDERADAVGDSELVSGMPDELALFLGSSARYYSDKLDVIRECAKRLIKRKKIKRYGPTEFVLVPKPSAKEVKLEKRVSELEKKVEQLLKLLEDKK